MGCVQARFVEVLERTVTALVPWALAFFLFMERVGALGA